ncbi:MAG: DUF368 domain-containing protein, partial [Haloferacaceae archaeon]
MATVLQWVGIYLRGFCMGAADAVPGVSGGTIALITGVYERLIAALTAVDAERLGRLFRALRDGDATGAARVLEALDVRFLLVLGAGITSAVVTVLRLIGWLLSVSPIETYGFFFGLIGASAVVLYRDVSVATRSQRAAAAGGFLLAFLSSGYGTTEVGSSLPVLFVAGSVAISAMLLPGLSGALLLLVLGQYEYMSTALGRFTDALFGAVRGDGLDPVFATGTPVMAFCLGAVVGLLAVAHLVRAALERNRQVTLAFLVSLIVGALRAPVEQATLELTRLGTEWTAYWV